MPAIIQAADTLPHSRKAHHIRQPAPVAKQPKREPVGIQSVEIALAVLQAMVREGGAASLSDLSRATGLQPSKLHRYLVSLVRCGIAAKLPASGLYDLGPEARQLGAAAFSRFDGVSLAQDCVASLAAATGQTVLLYVWTEQGATLIRQQNGFPPLPMMLRIGSTVPLRHSGVGHVFLAFMPETITGGVVRTEAEDDERQDSAAFDRTLAAIRSDGYFWTANPILPGTELLAAPVFELQRRLHSVIAVALPRRTVTPALKKTLTTQVMDAASTLSRELGAYSSAR